VPFIAMRYLGGGSMAQMIRRTVIALEDIERPFAQVCAALDYAHQQGIIHRDLKPGNLFLRGGQVERVALLDFGVARRRQATQIMTRTGSLVGTPEYMAPEQARGERNLTPATDVFALGCVVYECLTGRPPFIADHVAARLAKILFEEPPPIARILPEIPEQFAGVLGRMLAKPNQPVGSAKYSCALRWGLRNAGAQKAPRAQLTSD
jgi:serine/threonine protein kinase